MLFPTSRLSNYLYISDILKEVIRTRHKNSVFCLLQLSSKKYVKAALSYAKYLHAYQVIFPQYCHPPGAAENASERKSSQTWSVYHKKNIKEKRNYFADIFLFFTVITHALPIQKVCQLEKGIFTSLKLSFFICLFVLPTC